MLNHFRLINGSWDQAIRLNIYAFGGWANLVKNRAKSNC
jgi:hypothetical protein